MASKIEQAKRKQQAAQLKALNDGAKRREKTMVHQIKANTDQLQADNPKALGFVSDFIEAIHEAQNQDQGPDFEDPDFPGSWSTISNG